MTKPDKSELETVRQTPERPAYGTFPSVDTHGPRDKRCFHGKPEDWTRVRPKRTFGGKIK